jgi:hypothetical protein
VFVAAQGAAVPGPLEDHRAGVDVETRNPIEE